MTEQNPIQDAQKPCQHKPGEKWADGCCQSQPSAHAQPEPGLAQKPRHVSESQAKGGD
jgi:hypothetical protein